ncbi:MAG: penicillin-binding transpeptidase domain-containing protein [Polyangiaceae bacterium]
MRNLLWGLWGIGCASAALGCASAPKSGTPSPSASATRDAPASTKVAEAAPAASRISEERLRAMLAEHTSRPAAVVVLAGDGSGIAAVGQGGIDAADARLRPGSTVKPLLAWQAAKAGALRPGHHVECRGEFPVADKTLTCFEKHGNLSLSDAIATSCNSYFYDVAQRWGLAGVHGGFVATGLVDSDDASLSDESLRARQGPPATSLHAVWAPVIGIGHGPLHVSPTRLAKAYAKMARELGDTPVEREILAGLRAAVQSPKGTAQAASVANLDVVGKTGTAESGDAPDAPQSESLGWFVGYAPARQPDVIVAVVVQGAGPGGKSAAPLASRVFRETMQHR